MSQEKTKYTLEDLKEFEDALGFLSDFESKENTFKVVDVEGKTLNRQTFHLMELAKVNSRRKQLIKELTK